MGIARHARDSILDCSGEAQMDAAKGAITLGYNKQ